MRRVTIWCRSSSGWTAVYHEGKIVERGIGQWSVPKSPFCTRQRGLIAGFSAALLPGSAESLKRFADGRRLDPCRCVAELKMRIRTSQSPFRLGLGDSF